MKRWALSVIAVLGFWLYSLFGVLSALAMLLWLSAAVSLARSREWRPLALLLAGSPFAASTVLAISTYCAGTASLLTSGCRGSARPVASGPGGRGESDYSPSANLGQQFATALLLPIHQEAVKASLWQNRVLVLRFNSQFDDQARAPWVALIDSDTGKVLAYWGETVDRRLPRQWT